jgi:hypothetical protein
VLKRTETGLEDREAKIRDQLIHIALIEMKKGIDEDEMLDRKLKAIEIVNIADMAAEKDNLEISCNFHLQKKADLDKIEEELLKEKNRRENKKN